MRVKISSMGRPEPLPEDIYRLEWTQNEEHTWDSGTWGFRGRGRVSSGDQSGRMVFEDLFCLDSEGGPSGALFRFVQTYTALTGNELEGELEYDPDEKTWYENDSEVGIEAAKDFFRERATEMINFEASAEVAIEEGEGQYEGRSRNRIKGWK